jgi:hypothetical protein
VKARIDALVWGALRAVPYAYCFALGMMFEQLIGGAK